MKEVLIFISSKDWNLIKSGRKTIVIQKDHPEAFFPLNYRVFVCIKKIRRLVGKFECNKFYETIRPEQFAEGACMTKEELLAHGNEICGWYIKKGSVVEYETTFPLEYATGIKEPPETWCYISKEEANE